MLNGYHGAVFPHRFTGFTRHVAAQIGRLKIFPFWSYRCSGGSVTSVHTDRLGRFFKPEFFGYAGENLCDTFSVRFRDDPDFVAFDNFCWRPSRPSSCPAFFRLSNIKLGGRNKDGNREKPRDRRDGAKADGLLHDFILPNAMISQSVERYCLGYFGPTNSKIV